MVPYDMVCDDSAGHCAGFKDVLFSKKKLSYSNQPTRKAVALESTFVTSPCGTRMLWVRPV